MEYYRRKQKCVHCDKKTTHDISVDQSIKGQEAYTFICSNCKYAETSVCTFGTKAKGSNPPLFVPTQAEIKESEQISNTRHYFESGCRCIKHGLMNKQLDTVNDYHAVQYYKKHCRCSRNYI